MKKRAFAIAASAALALSVVAGASARGPANQFTAGSGKADVGFGPAGQHLSFSAHTTSGFCEATGHVTYRSSTVNFSADVTRLAFSPGATGGGSAYFSGPVTKIDNPFFGAVGDTAQFDVTDANMHPDGTGDTILFEGIFPANVDCFAPFTFGDPITSGNIIVKTDPLLP